MQIEYYILGKKIVLSVSEEVAAVLQETDWKEKALDKQDDRHLTGYLEGESELEMANPQKSVTAIVEQRERFLQLLTAITKLSPIQQRRIRLYYFDGFTMREIAAIEGVKFQVIGKSIKDAEKKLKKFLEMG